MQTKEQLEEFYKTADPWGYKVNHFDKQRKDILLKELEEYGTFEKAIDIGAGEGWITTDLPAKTIHGYEISDEAAARFPDNVKRVKSPRGKYDLVVVTGVLYKEYDYEEITKLVERLASKVVIAINIKDLEINNINLPVKKEYDFPYREYTEHLVIYEVPTAQRGKSKPQQLQSKKRTRKTTKK